MEDRIWHTQTLEYVYRSQSVVYKIDIKYSLHLIYPRSGRASQKSRISDYILSKNIKDKSEQSLALAYILYLYESYRLHISDWNFGTQKKWKTTKKWQGM